MTTKFLGTSDDGGDPTDGTLNILGNTLSANNLLANLPVKTNGSRNLVSSKLELSDVNDLEGKLQPLEQKTLYIDGTLYLGATKINSDILADKFILNNSPNPAQYLKTDGTSSILNDNEYIISNTDPFNTFSSITDRLGDVFYNTNSSSLFGFQPPFRDQPIERTPASVAYTNFNVATEAEFNNALNAEYPPSTRKQITLTADITFTSSKTISDAIRLTSDTGYRVITFSSATNIINFTAGNHIIESVEFKNSNTGSSATCIAFTSQTASNNYVKNCVFRTNEFAITTLNTQIQITDSFFRFDGTPDSHRYIALYKNTGNTIIARNQFSGNTIPSTACIFISSVAGSSFTNGKFSFNNNTSSASFPVQRLCIADSAFNANDNLQFYIHDNIIQSSSGFMIFYNAIPMTGVLRVVAYNNVETLGGGATGSKGIIACDNISATTLPSRTGAPYITTFNNTQPALRTDYTGWTSDNNVAYNNTVISTVGNTPKLYSAVLQDIIGSDSSVKTTYINLPLEANGTRFLQNVYADKFIIQGGPSPAGYLMSDGTVLTSSSSNINSNIYFYTYSTVTTAPPTNGQIRFNNSTISSATAIFISHLTSDGTDIDAFLALISKLSIIYIQDRDNSANYSRFNVNGNPNITPNSFVTLDVTFIDGGGTGTTAYPNNMNIFLSIFTNDVEIDSRLSNLETSTQNLTATSSDSTFSKTLKMNSQRIQSVAEPVNSTDATTKNYVDTANNLKVNKSGDTMTGNLNMNTTNKIINVGDPSSAGDVATKNYVDTADNLKLNKSGDTMTGNLNMNSIYRIINVGDPSSAGDATNKNYVDTANNLKLNLSGGTMTGALLMNNNNISGVGNFTLFNSTSNGIAYFGGGFLANANKDFFIQSGGTTIQSMITQISLSAGNVIRLSSGSWTENVTCFNQNYTICGAPCALFNQMTQITGNFTIGSSSAVSTQTRIRLKDLKIIGNLIFNNDSVYQELRTYIDNCDISGTITFPTSAVNTSGLGIYFTNCSFSGSNNPLCTIPNQALYNIYFTDCTFNSQPITNNLSAGNFSRLVFTNCSILPSLSLGNCVLNGLNASAVVSSLTAGSIKLSGASTSFLKGNGGLDTASYTTIVNVTPFSMVFLGTTVSGFKARYITDGTSKIVTITCPSGAVFTNTSGASNGFSASGFPIPAEIIPSTSITSFIRLASGAVNLPLCYCVVASNGGFSFGTPDLSSSFSANGVIGFQGNTTITYST